MKVSYQESEKEIAREDHPHELASLQHEMKEVLGSQALGDAFPDLYTIAQPRYVRTAIRGTKTCPRSAVLAVSARRACEGRPPPTAPAIPTATPCYYYSSHSIQEGSASRRDNQVKMQDRHLLWLAT